ncbi:MAG TPA: flagellar basal-body rod protein FlgG [Burkholderiaceae bacterium]|nr:flagellar basal-body rod protein FlgG [Burkholderiaceae bacterium]
MIDSLYIGATGLNAQQLNVDTIANNLANVNTAGFKRGRVDFEDVMYREVQRANGMPGSAGNAHLLGSGVGVAGVHKLFTTGELKKTDNGFDIAIRGDGFLEVVLADGNHAYTRTGRLTVNKEGFLASAEGYALRPSIAVPADAKNIDIAANGVVTASFGDARAPEELGQIELASFSNTSGLAPAGENLYRSTEGSGEPTYGKPGDDGRGTLAQGYLETSNVKLVEEMVNLMVAQRGYEVSAKVIQASDEMMSLSNNLRR